MAGRPRSDMQPKNEIWFWEIVHFIFIIVGLSFFAEDLQTKNKLTLVPRKSYLHDLVQFDFFLLKST